MITQENTEETKHKAVNDSRDQNIWVGEAKSGLLSLKMSLDRNSKNKKELEENFEENAAQCIQILKNIRFYSDRYAIQIGA